MFRGLSATLAPGSQSGILELDFLGFCSPILDRVSASGAAFQALLASWFAAVGFGAPDALILSRFGALGADSMRY